MDLSKEETDFIHQVACAKMCMTASLEYSLKLYGPKVTQTALDFLSMLLNQSIEQANLGDITNGIERQSNRANE